MTSLTVIYAQFRFRNYELVSCQIRTDLFALRCRCVYIYYTPSYRLCRSQKCSTLCIHILHAVVRLCRSQKCSTRCIHIFHAVVEPCRSQKCSTRCSRPTALMHFRMDPRGTVGTCRTCSTARGVGVPVRYRAYGAALRFSRVYIIRAFYIESAVVQKYPGTSTLAYISRTVYVQTHVDRVLISTARLQSVGRHRAAGTRQP